MRLSRGKRSGNFQSRGVACPLSALTGKHPGVCLAMESLVSEIVDAPTHQCFVCEGRPRCCFTIDSGRP